MAFVQADIDALDVAYKGGKQSFTVRRADGAEYQESLRTVDEYLKLKALMKADIDVTAGAPKTRTTLVSHSRG